MKTGKCYKMDLQKNSNYKIAPVPFGLHFSQMQIGRYNLCSGDTVEKNLATLVWDSSQSHMTRFLEITTLSSCAAAT
jgi:hypothetical protein